MHSSTRPFRDRLVSIATFRPLMADQFGSRAWGSLCCSPRCLQLPELIVEQSYWRSNIGGRPGRWVTRRVISCYQHAQPYLHRKTTHEDPKSALLVAVLDGLKVAEANAVNFAALSAQEVAVILSETNVSKAKAMQAEILGMWNESNGVRAVGDRHA